MLKNIHVKNIALIKEVDINFSDGLNIVTGETGAGKSLIIGSVAIGLGAKVSKEYISSNEKEALIELTFTNLTDEIISKLKELEINDFDNVVIQRRITEKRTINKINTKTVSLNTLRSIGSKFMQIHGQHDNQVLLDKSFHLRLLDNYAGDKIKEVKDDYQNKYSELIKVVGELKDIESLNVNRARDIDYYEFVLDEINKIDPKIDEDIKLKNEYSKMIHIRNSYQELLKVQNNFNFLFKDTIDTSKKVFSNLKNEEEAKDISKLIDEFSEIFYILRPEINSYIDSMEYDEDKFHNIEQRIDQINNLKRKYGNTIDKVLEHKNNVVDILNKLKDAENSIIKLKSKGNSLKKELVNLSNKLHEIRIENAKILENKIIKNLEELNFHQAKFKFNINSIGKLSVNGQDDVEMYISTNLGQKMRPLAEIASGGELSRIMLAIQSIITSSFGVRSIIFDEVDAGISGRTGALVSTKLQEMSKDMQIICITHLPQIACVGDEHIKIEKTIENNETVTRLTKLDDKQSIEEVARLLGGINITQATIDNAVELRDSLKKGEV